MIDSPSDQPLISIIVPSFNQGKYIEATILSVIHQTYPVWELIIQDSCSNDETEEVCTKYAGLDSRIRFFKEKDKGFADGVNKGLNKAKGLIGAIQSSDDYYASSDVFEKVIQHFHDHRGLTLVTSGFRMVDNDYRFIDIRSVKRKAGWVDADDSFRLIDHFAQGSTFFNIGRAREIGGLNPHVDMVADTDLWVRMLNMKPRAAQTALRVDGIWSHLIMHPEQRTADQSKFYLGRCKMYMGYWENQDMEVPIHVKDLSVKGHLADTFQYLLYKKKSTSEVESLYRKYNGKEIPLRWRLKRSLSLFPLFHKGYFRNYKDHDSAEILSNERGEYAVWFDRKPDNVMIHNPVQTNS